DAFDGLHIMDAIKGGASETARDGKAAAAKAAAVVAARSASATDDAEELVGEDAKLGVRRHARPRAARAVVGDTSDTTRSDVNPNAPVPRAPFYGSRVVNDTPLEDVFAFVNETALFKGQWQFKQGRRTAEDYRALVAEKVRPVYEELKRRSESEKLLT